MNYKHILSISLALFAYSANVFSTKIELIQDDKWPDILSKKEDSSKIPDYEWNLIWEGFDSFDSNFDLLTKAMLSLNQEEIPYVMESKKIREFPEKISAALLSISKNFCKVAKDSNVDLSYDEQYLCNCFIIIKYHMQSGNMSEPRNATEAKAYVFKTMLTEDEQALMHKSNYDKATQEEIDTMLTKLSERYGAYIVKKGFIKEEERELKEKTYFMHSRAKLDAVYGKKN